MRSKNEREWKKILTYRKEQIKNNNTLVKPELTLGAFLTELNFINKRVNPLMLLTTLSLITNETNECILMNLRRM